MERTSYKARGHAAYALVYCEHSHRTLKTAVQCAGKSEHYDTVECSSGEAWEVIDQGHGPQAGRKLRNRCGE